MINFLRRLQALEFFQETEGAQMLFARSVGEVTTFFDLSGQATGFTMYAVSGHRIAFRDRYVASSISSF